MKSLESRKQLLIAESDLNRAQLFQEWHRMADEARALAGKAKTISLMVSAAGLVLAGLTAWRHCGCAPGAKKTSWWQTILKSAGLFSTVWSAFRRMRSRAD